eukprot:1143406-Pelagomonas_calceolata.AAC.4
MTRSEGTIADFAHKNRLPTGRSPLPSICASATSGCDPSRDVAALLSCRDEGDGSSGRPPMELSGVVSTRSWHSCLSPTADSQLCCQLRLPS